MSPLMNTGEEVTLRELGNAILAISEALASGRIGVDKVEVLVQQCERKLDVVRAATQRVRDEAARHESPKFN